jgi:hypothetical protein
MSEHGEFPLLLAAFHCMPETPQIVRLLLMHGAPRLQCRSRRLFCYSVTRTVVRLQVCAIDNGGASEDHMVA